MSAIVKRVHKLVALSGSSNENEARTAAFLACRLIREHGLYVGESPTGSVRSDRGASSERRPDRQPDRRPKIRVTRGPYARARHVSGNPRCHECSEPILSDDACVDADGLAVHGDCIPKGERP